MVQCDSYSSISRVGTFRITCKNLPWICKSCRRHKLWAYSRNHAQVHASDLRCWRLAELGEKTEARMSDVTDDDDFQDVISATGRETAVRASKVATEPEPQPVTQTVSVIPEPAAANIECDAFSRSQMVVHIVILWITIWLRDCCGQFVCASRRVAGIWGRFCVLSHFPIKLQH